MWICSGMHQANELMRVFVWTYSRDAGDVRWTRRKLNLN